MIRRFLFPALGLATLAAVAVGRDATSYVGTWAGWVKQSVQDSVPLSFEIDRARTLIRDLVPDIRSNMHRIAKEEVEVEKLNQQIAELTTKLDKDRGELVRLKNDAATGQASFQYAGRRYTLDEVKSDLAHRFERFKTQEATLKSLGEMRQAREQSVVAARQKLENMLAVKRQLEVDVEHLEARLKMVEAAQTTSHAQFDDSQLSRAKELVLDLRTRLDVAERLTQADLPGAIPLEVSDRGAIVEEIDAYLDRSANTLLADQTP